MAEATKEEHKKEQQEMEANKTQKEREESADVNEQIEKFIKH